MINRIDKRTKHGREIASRLRRQTILDNMPKVYFISDGDRYRVGRTDWPSDAFNIVETNEFEIFRKVYTDLNMPLLDMTDEEE